MRKAGESSHEMADRRPIRDKPLVQQLSSVDVNTLGVLGFLLSLVALAWNVVLTWLRWPRIAVVLKKSVHITISISAGPTRTASSVVMGSDQVVASKLEPPDSVSETVHLVIVNTGAEACTIANIGLRAGTAGIDYEYLAQEEHPVPIGPTLPVRVEGHGSEVWIFKEQHLGIFGQGTLVTGWAERYVTLPWWRKNLRRWRDRVTGLSEQQTPEGRWQRAKVRSELLAARIIRLDTFLTKTLRLEQAHARRTRSDISIVRSGGRRQEKVS